MRQMLVAGLALGLCACGGQGVTDSAERSAEIRAGLAALTNAEGPRVYYAGDVVAGLPLTHVDVTRSGHALFVYGECRPEGEGENFTCRGPQIQIQNWPLAERHPTKFQLTPTQPAPCRRGTIRGVPTAVFTTSGGALEVYAGSTVVVIFARHDLLQPAAAALRSVDGRTRPDGMLPQPPRHVADALVRCAIEPPERKLRELERTATIPLYWVGLSFEGHPLARAEGTGEHARFVYGRCAIGANYESDQACWPPLDIQVAPLAEHHPSAYSPAIDCSWEEARGALVSIVRSAHTVDVFVGSETVTMVGPDLALLRRALRELRALDRIALRDEPLPAPPAALRHSLADRCSATGSGSRNR